MRPLAWLALELLSWVLADDIARSDTGSPTGALRV